MVINMFAHGREYVGTINLWLLNDLQKILRRSFGEILQILPKMEIFTHLGPVYPDQVSVGLKAKGPIYKWHFSGRPKYFFFTQKM